MGRHLLRTVLAAMLVLGFCAGARADYMADMGFVQLQTELGSAVPTGAGVVVGQVEAAATAGGTNYLPFLNGTTNPQFTGKTITVVGSGTVSDHATWVGGLFYGNSASIARGVTQIYGYNADYWLGSDFLRTGSGLQPLSSPARVTNHSWVGQYGGSNADLLATDSLSRLDYAINRDQAIHVVAMNNGSGNKPLLGSSFNAIAAGRSDGYHAQGSYALGGLYTAGRTRPDVVAPASYTSDAAPMVAAAATLLVQTGHGNPSLSTDPLVTSTTIAGIGTIYNAERPTAVKAALMAGASRDALSGYTINTTNGLNSVFGAGQVNIYNSYHIIAAGEQNSMQDGAGGNIGRYGFDYDPYFGGQSSSNRMGSYHFTTSSAGVMTASLAWNVGITGTGTGNFYHLGLYLYDATDTMNPLLLAWAAGEADNTENIWYSLAANRHYLLQVRALTEDAFLWDYSLGWDINANLVPLPPGLLLLGPGLITLALARRRRNK